MIVSPSVSVVVPTYNRSGRVTRAVDSVLAQTYGAFELLVVDDASTDDTAAVIESYDDERIEYLSHDENRGANAARNWGIERARGKYVAFLDADDEWKPTKLERQVKIFEDTPEDVVLVYTGIEKRGADRSVIARSMPDQNGDVTKRLLLGNFIGSFSAIAVRRSVLEPRPLNEDLPSWQDWEFYLRLSRNWSFRAVPEPLTVKYSDAANQISSNFQRKRNISYPAIRDLTTDIAREYGWLFRRRVRASLAFHLGYAALRNGEYDEARKFLGRAAAYYPVDIRPIPYLIAAIGGERLYEFGRSVKRRFVTS